MKVFINANLIDGNGGPVINDAAVLIDGERIVSAGPRAAATWPEGTEVVDGTGLTIMPGLIDCHDHLASKDYTMASRWGLTEPISLGYLRTAKALEDTLLAGYTCVREAGGLDIGFKQAIEEGLIPGPRLALTVGILSPTGCLAYRPSPSGPHNPFHVHPPLPVRVAHCPDAVRPQVL